MINGFVLVDKPAGPTSHDIVNIIRRLAGQKRVGHTGTLDPAATGLIIVLLGKGTRLAQWVLLDDKAYEGTIRLGVATDTLDAQGRETERRPCRPTPEELRVAAVELTGLVSQRPPAYSAVKLNGKPAYRLARKGETPVLKARQVKIERFEAAFVQAGDFPLVEFAVDCSSGVYIRSLAADLGEKLGCPAHLESLRRIRIGRFNVADSTPVGAIRQSTTEEFIKMVRPLDQAVDFPRVRVGSRELPDIKNGKEVPGRIDRPAEKTGVGAGATLKLIHEEDGRLVGLAKAVGPAAVNRPPDIRVKPFLVLEDD